MDDDKNDDDDDDNTKTVQIKKEEGGKGEGDEEGEKLDKEPKESEEKEEKEVKVKEEISTNKTDCDKERDLNRKKVKKSKILLKAHRLILASCSPLIRKILDNNITHSIDNLTIYFPGNYNQIHLFIWEGARAGGVWGVVRNTNAIHLKRERKREVCRFENESLYITFKVGEEIEII